MNPLLVCVFITCRELSRKEAVRTKRSLRLFREAWEGLRSLVEGLARLGIIPLPLPPLDRTGEETTSSRNGPKNGSKNGAGRGKGAGRRKQRARGWVFLCSCN